MEKTVNKQTLSTEVFNGKNVPDFIRNHKHFKNTPIKLNKIFPKIGLKNFREKSNIARPPFNLNGEGQYVLALINALQSQLNYAKQQLACEIDYLAFCLSKEERKANKNKVKEAYKMLEFIDKIIQQCVGINAPKLVVLSPTDNKVDLKLYQDIVFSGETKPAVKAGISLFKIYHKIETSLKDFKIDIIKLDYLNEFKVFCKENIPNKSYDVIFSSEGEQGAWDILTMSMRGFKSCQRWDGEYRLCLIGSILSKYSGIIYLTSGADFDGYGPKMLKRCNVRFAINILDRKPVLLLDKMYPDFDQETLNAFQNSLKNKSNLEVIYGPNCQEYVRYLYIPHEDIKEELPEMNLPYLDTPLKSKYDFKILDMINKDNLLSKQFKVIINNVILNATREVLVSNRSEDLYLKLNCNVSLYIENLLSYIQGSNKYINSIKNITSVRDYIWFFISLLKKDTSYRNLSIALDNYGIFVDGANLPKIGQALYPLIISEFKNQYKYYLRTTR